MRELVTPELRQVLIAALVDGEVGLKELGCELSTVDGEPASETDKLYWNDYRSLDNEQKDLIREGLMAGFIDIKKLIN